ncbi:MAG: hypothetical protein HQL69_15010 [Magnetococcales bacterium]|nr:hypothetical protein [Magnetococcales bacterium]
MKKTKSILTFGIIPAFISCFFLILPLEVKAEMVRSQLQTNHDVKQVKEILNLSKLDAKQVKEILNQSSVIESLTILGFSKDESEQLVKVLLEKDVITSINQTFATISANGMIPSQKIIKKMEDSFSSSLHTHASNELKRKITDQNNQLSMNFMNSQLNKVVGSYNVADAIDEVKQHITIKKLTGIGVGEKEAKDIVAELKITDINQILSNEPIIGYGAKINTMGWLIIAVLAAFALLASNYEINTGPAVVVIGSIVLFYWFMGKSKGSGPKVGEEISFIDNNNGGFIRVAV